MSLISLLKKISSCFTFFTALLLCTALHAQVINTSFNPAPHWGAPAPGSVARSGGNHTNNGNAALGLTYDQEMCGLNYVQGSVQIERRSAPGISPNGTGLPSQVTIAGIPGCATIKQAYFTFIAAWTISNTPPPTNLSLTNPASSTLGYVPALIGTDIEKGWLEKGTAVYRADVTASISGNGVYSFDITGFTNGAREIDGATLMIVYTDASATYQGRLIYWDGALVSGPLNGNATQTVTMNGFNACGNSTAGNAFLIVTDMQDNCNGGFHTTTLNGVATVFPNLFMNFDVAPTIVTAGQTSATFTADAFNSDYNCTAAVGLYFQTTSCAVCNPTSSLTLTPSFNATVCGQCNGDATVTVAGGSGSYTYLWTPSAQITATATNLCAGNYTVDVTDLGGCGTAQANVTVTATGGVAASIATSTQNLCAGDCNGDATAAGVGGTPPYTYSWLPSGGNGITASNLCAGAYTVTVTDNNNCSSTSVANIVDPVVLSATTNFTDALCNGGTDGTATAVPLGGTGAYTFSWAPSGGNLITANNLAAGLYTVTVTDGNNCTTTANATISEPLILTSAISAQTNVTCNGGADGTATVTPNGGTGAYTYLWAPSGGVAATENNLAAGNYSVTVTDVNGCTSASNVIVTEPAPVVAGTTTISVSCNGGTDGSATVTPVGGTAPYTYLWSPTGGIGATEINLAPATYTVTVTDANGCIQTGSATITEPALLTASAASVSTLCNGSADGSATATPAGGTGPYIYLWAPSGGNAITEINIAAGNYSVTVTDNNGCTAVANVIVTEPTAVTAVASATDALCNGDATGTSTVVAGGGTAGYTYQWLPGGTTTATATGLIAGAYTITVTDANGCTQVDNTNVAEPALLTSNANATQSTCSLPNGTATVIANGGTGAYTYLWSPGGNTSANPTSLIANNYSVTVTDANGCTSIANTIVTDIPAQTSTANTLTNVLCNGGNDGSADVTVTGGTAPFTYSWSPLGGTGVTSTPLAAGTYTVTVTDNNNCLSTSTVIITEPTAVTANITVPVPTVCIGQNAALIATASGGTAPYTYLWNTTDVTATVFVTPASSTAYSVVVTDNNGCVILSNATINVYPSLSVSTSANVAVCSGQSTTLGANASGGNGGPYTYSWLPVAGLSCTNCQNPVANPLSLTTYTVTASDNCGTPVVTANSTASIYPLPVVTLGSDVQQGCVPLCINFYNSTQNTVSCSWNFGMPDDNSIECNPQFCYTENGSYSIRLNVIDANGCAGTFTDTNYITADVKPIAHFEASTIRTTQLDPIICFKDESVNANSWSWSFGDISFDQMSDEQNPCHNYTDTGYFCVKLVAINNDNCIDSIEHCVYIEPGFLIYVPNAFTPNNDNTNDFFFSQGFGINPDFFDLWVYNRYGTNVFHTDDVYGVWSGKVTDGSEQAASDVYVWRIFCKDYTGVTHDLQGKVSLIR